jgi:hypothetical protein
MGLLYLHLGIPKQHEKQMKITACNKRDLKNFIYCTVTDALEQPFGIFGDQKEHQLLAELTNNDISIHVIKPTNAVCKMYLSHTLTIHLQVFQSPLHS